MAEEEISFNWVDIGCLISYFIGIILVALYAMYKVNRSTETGYFLAGRYMTWFPVGASIFASNIGSEHFIGLSGSGAAGGISVGAFEWNSCIIVQLLGWVFLPVYISSRVTTLPEYMTKRFGSERIRVYLAVLSLFLYVFTKISVNLFSGAIFIQQALKWDQTWALVLLLAITAFCTITGGLATVIYTDTLQAVLMNVGMVLVAALSFSKVGGFEGLYEKYPHAVPTGYAASNISSCDYPSTKSFILLRGINDSGMPWLGFILGQTMASIWYWAADQMMVQRAMSSKSLSHAQGGCLLAGFLKLFPIFLIVMPGMISRIIRPDTVGCSNPEACFEFCGNRVSCSNLAYPTLVLTLLPQGAKGFMLAVMLAALMSDLTSIFNSAATLFTIDIYAKVRNTQRQRELMIAGRVFVGVMVIISILWLPVISAMQGGQLYHYIQGVAANLAPPIATVYLAAILWPRANETGAFWSLMVGAVLGVTRMVLDFSYGGSVCGVEDNRPFIVKDIHYMYIALMLSVITFSVLVVISLCTDEPRKELLFRTTYWTRFDSKRGPSEIPLTSTSSSFTEKESAAMLEDSKVNPSFASKEQVNLDFLPRKEGDSKNTFLATLVKFSVWFCGLEENEQTLKEEAAHIEQLGSLEQSKRDKIILNSILVALVTLTVALFFIFTFTWGEVEVGPVSGNFSIVDNGL